MRKITHRLAFAHDGTANRYGAVFDPNDGGIQASVALGDAALLDRAVEAPPVWAVVYSQRRARHVQLQGAG